MRIGHASISENGNNGRDGKARSGDQTGKEVCIRTFYKKPWSYLLRCKDSSKAELMASACEWLCNSNLVGYDQSQRNTLHSEMVKINYQYRNLKNKCECDCSSFMTVLAEIAEIFPRYNGNNAPVTANMVNLFQQTGYFDVLTKGINEEQNLKRGDILVGPPNTHTVMVLDNGVSGSDVPYHIANRRTLKKGMKGSDVLYMQQILDKLGYDLGKWGCDGDMGDATTKALLLFQQEHFVDQKEWDSICGKHTWMMLEKYK